MIAKNTGETTFQHSAIEIAHHDVVQESSPEPVGAFKALLPHRLDFVVEGLHQEIQGSGLRISLLVDCDGHGRGIEARAMPVEQNAFNVNRLRPLGFLRGGGRDEEIYCSVNSC